MSGQKIAIVTGAGSGIGRACSLGLMKAGFTVVLTGRRKDNLEETAKAGKEFGQSLVVPSDMTDPTSIAALFAKTVEAFGRLDRAVQQRRHRRAGDSAGRPDPRAVAGRGGHQPHCALPVHAACIPHHEGSEATRGGRIINNGSISAYAPRPLSSPYTATKHGISGLDACNVTRRPRL